MIPRVMNKISLSSCFGTAAYANGFVMIHMY